ncbi:MAG: DsrE family protein [Xanthomonadales bacterium]|nr:DsrE family protein [Xanthomonadales bacterium]
MRVSVMVLGDPAHSSAPRLALRALEMARLAGCVPDTAFLYHSGAYAALNLVDAARWRALADAGLRGLVCRSAWEERAPAGSVPAAPFVAASLVDWLQASERSGRVLRFGASG